MMGRVLHHVTTGNVETLFIHSKCSLHTNQVNDHVMEQMVKQLRHTHPFSTSDMSTDNSLFVPLGKADITAVVLLLTKVEPLLQQVTAEVKRETSGGGSESRKWDSGW